MTTFLHAADIHLDSPLRGLDRYEGAPVQEIRLATRRALENLVELAIDESVDFVVLSGDLYDGDWPDFDTGLSFVRQMSRLREAGIPVYGVLGNHDAASKITRRLPLPDNVYFFPTSAAETQRLGDLDVAIHGQSFASQCTTDDLAKNYPPPVSGCFNIGLLHTSLTGHEGHDRYAPCSESCLKESGYDYWALGHIHQRAMVSATRPTIAYPGNIQGRHIRETGPKGCLLVGVDDTHSVATEFRPLDVVRWEVANVSINGLENHADVLQRIEDELRHLVENAEGRLVATRVLLTGTTPLAAGLAADPRQLTANVQAIVLNIGADSLWVEKVRCEASQPSDARSEKGDDTPASEVITIVTELSKDASRLKSLGVDFDDLRLKLPPELKDAIKSDETDWCQRVLREAQAKLLSELRG